MSNDTPPAPAGFLANAVAWARRNHAAIAWTAAILLSVAQLLTWLLSGAKGPPPLPSPPPAIEAQADEHFGMGWHADEEATAAYVASLPVAAFQATPAGQADVPERDAFLFKATQAAWQKYSGPAKTEDTYPNVNQRATGECVGCGTKHVLDTLTAVLQETEHTLSDWEPIAVECIYAESRVDIGGGRLRGRDGSNGSWAARAATEKGNLLMRPYPAADLSHYDPMRTRQWGDRGVPPALRGEARKYLVKSAVPVKSWEDCRKAILQGYPVILCSNVGFNKPGTPPNSVNPGTRDSEGFVHPSGIWPHCMAGIGIQAGKRPGLFILNSWGNDAHLGPTGRGNPPAAGFWADPAAVDRICKQKGSECFALSGINGFPARKLDFFAAPAPRRSGLEFNPFMLALAR